ncbi:unnamed protein product [Porites evermanni]|uniref:Glutathione S-transferase n=1 Tax=Porites evermanni TaxID=104178 RepID=A0ABN8RLI9_9CNID|nr:unnamed protein product [Porites evermanni]
MSGYKLYYFPVRGRGEIDRWAFSAAKIEFEDIRLNRDEWLKEKETGRPPLGQMPFLVTPEGKILAQSGAIMKYICKKSGLSPSDSFDEAVADMIHDGVNDLRSLLLKAHFEKDEAAKETLLKEFFGTTLPARLEKYDALLKSKDKGEGFFLGAKLSYADISFVEFFNNLSLLMKKQKDEGKPTPDFEELFKKFPLLDGHYKRVCLTVRRRKRKRPNMSCYKLYYFPARAKGEIDRWAFAAAKIDFEDIRLNFGEEWRKEKESGRPPLGQMPFLVTPEGKILAQSGAIMKYIWKKAGLSPSDSFDEAVADMIHDGASDLRDLWLRTHFEKDEAAKETKMKEFLETTLPVRLEKYEALLKSKDEGKGFFLGAKLSYADISFVEFINSFSLMVKKQKDDGKPAPDLEDEKSKMSGYQLYYFPIRGRAEMARWAFAAAKIDFEDVRLSSEEWAKEKASGRAPFGQMPFLVTPEGNVVAQSGAIMKYICKKGGVSPSDSFDEALADMIHDGVYDLRNDLSKGHHEKDETKKIELMTKFFLTTLPERLGQFEAILKSRDEGKGFFCGDKLYYFPGRGRAEMARWAFAVAKIDFEDVRLGVEEWAKEKASGRSPLGQMPFLITPEGKILGQSGAIMKYICKKGGLSPADPFDEAIADMISDGVTDLFPPLIKMHFEKDETKKEELKKEFFGTTLPARLKKFETLLKNRNEGKDFFLGEKLTYADIIFFDFCNSFLSKGEKTVPEQLEKFPPLAQLYNRVLSVPEINEWVSKRPKTEM